MAELETNGNEKKCERKLKWCHAYPIRSIDLIITDTTDSILDDWCVDLCVNNVDVDVGRKSRYDTYSLFTLPRGSQVDPRDNHSFLKHSKFERFFFATRTQNIHGNDVNNKLI